MIQEIPSRTLGFVLNDVARLMRKRFEQRARAASLGLTRAQAAVLANLARQEGINQVSLAQILELEPITLARLLDRLQAASLIERRPDPKDRRAHLLYLTNPLIRCWTGFSRLLPRSAKMRWPASRSLTATCFSI